MNLIARLMEPNGREGPHLSPAGPSLPGQGHGQENKSKMKTCAQKLYSGSRGPTNNFEGTGCPCAECHNPHPNCTTVHSVILVCCGQPCLGSKPGADIPHTEGLDKSYAWVNCVHLILAKSSGCHTAALGAEVSS